MRYYITGWLEQFRSLFLFGRVCVFQETSLNWIKNQSVNVELKNQHTISEYIYIYIYIYGCVCVWATEKRKVEGTNS